jgi:hypothetical protein
MADKNNKYPKSRMVKASKPGYVGSGALHDRVKMLKDEKIKTFGRGEEGAWLHDGFREHYKSAEQPHKSNHMEGAPGTESSKPQCIGKTHKFRCHTSAKGGHEGQHGVTSHDNDTALRFSGADSAHQIGKGRAKFDKDGAALRIQGLSEGGKFGHEAVGKDTSKRQKGNKGGQKGHKEVHKFDKKGERGSAGKRKATGVAPKF